MSHFSSRCHKGKLSVGTNPKRGRALQRPQIESYLEFSPFALRISVFGNARPRRRLVVSVTTLAHLSDFIQNLEESKLLSPERFEAALAFIATLPEHEADDPAAVAKALNKEQFLSRLQSQRLLEGRTRGFFINQYRIDEILGSGGMGWVYVARDLKRDEDVALKMLCEQNEQDAGLLARFQLEAEAGARLNHPAIIRTREVGEAPGLYGKVHYLVMDMVQGVGVDELVALGGPTAWPVASHIVRQVAEGLQHAHQQGLVHRDIKPANVLVDADNNAHILDFGLSVASQSEQSAEFSLAMIFGQDCLGTADYIAPEQARDSFGVDHRADLYSLGAMLYFMLAGKVLFPDQKTRAAKIDAHWNLEPRPIRELVPKVPEELARIVHQMLAKSPDQRFRAAQEIADALQPFAKPKKIHFEFQQILNRRFLIAQLRQKQFDEQSQRTSAASSLSVCTLDSKVMRPSLAQMETEIRKDTQVGIKDHVPVPSTRALLSTYADPDDCEPRLALPE